MYALLLVVEHLEERKEKSDITKMQMSRTGCKNRWISENAITLNELSPAKCWQTKLKLIARENQLGDSECRRG